MSNYSCFYTQNRVRAESLVEVKIGLKLNKSNKSPEEHSSFHLKRRLGRSRIRISHLPYQMLKIVGSDCNTTGTQADTDGGTL
ncbi:putative methyltransferase tdiE [Fusarium oxysporum f. sp. albedinis]|nr:putative methyltransferase tdiE [Fusarium oxysporum f. sp. albedinis]